MSLNNSRYIVSKFYWIRAETLNLLNISITMNGEEFYNSLKEVYEPVLNAFRKEKKIGKEQLLNNSQWTELMAKVLDRIRTKAGFDSADSEIMKEISIIRGKGKGRIDHKWQNSKETVFIEHENNPYTSLKPEITNLLNADGDLRVLIIYTKIKKPDTKRIQNDVLDELNKNVSNRKFEFLLLIGKEYVGSKDDWEAVSYRLVFEPFPLP